MLRGERHAQGEQNARGSSITGLYIASLSKIILFLAFNLKNNSTYSWKKSATPQLVNMGEAETHCVNDKGHFRIQSQTKAYLRFYRQVLL
jgi:hypothetical protein